MPRRRDSQALSEERLLDAALQLVDEAGMGALSMRRLGARLGVDPMAVYYYFPNKETLVRRLVGSVFAGLRPIDAEGSWQARVLDWADAYQELALAHPNLVLQIVTNRDAVDVAAALANEALYAALRQSGLRPEAIEGAADTLVDYVNGFVLSQAGGREDGRTGSEGFRFAVGLILGGIERLASTA